MVNFYYIRSTEINEVNLVLQTVNNLKNSENLAVKYTTTATIMNFAQWVFYCFTLYSDDDCYIMACALYNVSACDISRETGWQQSFQFSGIWIGQRSIMHCSGQCIEAPVLWQSVDVNY